MAEQLLQRAKAQGVACVLSSAGTHSLGGTSLRLRVADSVCGAATSVVRSLQSWAPLANVSLAASRVDGVEEVVVLLPAPCAASRKAYAMCHGGIARAVRAGSNICLLAALAVVLLAQAVSTGATDALHEKWQCADRRTNLTRMTLLACDVLRAMQQQSTPT